MDRALPSEWLSLCDPWVTALVASDGADANVRLIAADWFDENGDRAADGYPADASLFRRLAPRTDDETALDLMLLQLGGRWRCPLCRPPLLHMSCCMCDGRRWIDKPPHWGPPSLSRKALDPPNRPWWHWSLGLIGWEATEPHPPEEPVSVNGDTNCGVKRSNPSIFALAAASECHVNEDGYNARGVLWTDCRLESSDVGDGVCGIICVGTFVLDADGRVAGRRECDPFFLAANGNRLVGFSMDSRDAF